MAVPKLTSEELAGHLEKLPGWVESDGSLTKTFEFPTFFKAMEFVNKLAENAESVQHHPDLNIRYSKVTVMLSTHDSGGITKLDADMAAASDDVASLIMGG